MSHHISHLIQKVQRKVRRVSRPNSDEQLKGPDHGLHQRKGSKESNSEPGSPVLRRPHSAPALRSGPANLSAANDFDSSGQSTATPGNDSVAPNKLDSARQSTATPEPEQTWMHMDSDGHWHEYTADQCAMLTESFQSGTEVVSFDRIHDGNKISCTVNLKQQTETSVAGTFCVLCKNTKSKENKETEPEADPTSPTCTYNPGTAMRKKSCLKARSYTDPVIGQEDLNGSASLSRDTSTNSRSDSPNSIRSDGKMRVKVTIGEEGDTLKKVIVYQ